MFFKMGYLWHIKVRWRVSDLLKLNLIPLRPCWWIASYKAYTLPMVLNTVPGMLLTLEAPSRRGSRDHGSSFRALMIWVYDCGEVT